jgi:hypothetical protein
MSRKKYLILLGAPKCGTTSISEWLGAQPYGVLAKQKETLYFTDYSERSWYGPGSNFAAYSPSNFEEFDAEFHEKPDAELRIEASTDNLSCPSTPERIARFVERDDVEDFWLVAILRDPIERIVSEYEHTLRMGWQSIDLLGSLKAEGERAKKGYNPLFGHIARSRYSTQISRYRELFGDNILILDFYRISEASERNRILSWTGYLDETEVNIALEHKNQRNVVSHPAALRLLRDERLSNLGRAIFPKPVRPFVRRLITGGSVGRYKPTDAELGFMRHALQDEIDACVAHADIPTGNWTVSLA